jgi:glycosyltransferase involved in cell wall biosynthesis
LRSRTTAFAAACADAMRARPPRHIDVHNRVHVFTYLARRFPAASMTLWLHNDPHTMSGARRPAERARLLARAHRVLCVSGWVRHRFLDGIADPAGRVMVMPNALPEFPAPAPDAARQHLILFVGRLTQDKGALIFAEAAARALPFLPGWRAAMIGTGTPDMLAALRQAVAPVADRVSLPGFIPHADVLAAFAGAAIAVVPSLWDEAFGRTALEAMAAGCALIATNRGGLPEVVGDCGLVLEPPDTATLAAHIAALATDPVRRQDLQRRAAARAAARFAIKPWAAVLDAQRCAHTSQPCG